MKISHLIASAAIVGCTAAAWFILAAAMSQRTRESSADMSAEVAGVWNPELGQSHPSAWFETPNAPGGKAVILPSSSDVSVDLRFVPKPRGLILHRTYDVDFKATYEFVNPTRIPQTLYVSFPLPEGAKKLEGFVFRLGGTGVGDAANPLSPAGATRAVTVPASGKVLLEAAYQTRGTNLWQYSFPDKRRIAGFSLRMKTDFMDINFPVGTGSPKDADRKTNGKGWDLVWNYPDVLAVPSIGMDMPKLLNAGPVATRIAFFAPVSLVFFVTVLLLVAGLKEVPLHPMQIFFVSAGFFAFHLLFAYLVDLVPLYTSFAIATVVSLALVCGYLRAVGGKALFRIALPAQVAYLVLFSASFFFDGLTGITLTVCGVSTLALLMIFTARVNWAERFARSPRPPRMARGVVSKREAPWTAEALLSPASSTFSTSRLLVRGRLQVTPDQLPILEQERLPGGKAQGLRFAKGIHHLATHTLLCPCDALCGRPFPATNAHARRIQSNARGSSFNRRNASASMRSFSRTETDFHRINEFFEATASWRPPTSNRSASAITSL